MADAGAGQGVLPAAQYRARAALSGARRRAAAARRHRAPRRGRLGLCARRRRARRRHHPELRGHRHPPRRRRRGRPASRPTRGLDRTPTDRRRRRRPHSAWSWRWRACACRSRAIPLQALVSEPVKPVFPCVVMSNTIHAYISQSDKGELVIGAGTDQYISYSQTRRPAHRRAHARGDLRAVPDRSAACACCATGAASSTSRPTARRSSARRRCPGLYVNCGWGTGGFKATPGSGHVFAATIATGEPHPIAAPFTLDRFRTGRLIDEAAAAAVAH